MAIVIEEDKKQSTAPALLGWFVVIGIVLTAVYYILFAAPPAVVVTPPPAFNELAPIANINFTPGSVLSSTQYQVLKAYVTEPTSSAPGAIGRADPFVQ